MISTSLTVTDQFCGAGGSSQGVRRAQMKYGGNIKVRYALNHWQLAIKTHSANFPDTDHDCTDISDVDPRRYFKTDILITSPECTNHSIANKGKRDRSQLTIYDQMGYTDYEAQRSRATMWDVPRFAEVHKYKAIIVENVVDALDWDLFPAWIKAMEILNYKWKPVFFNSMFFHPTPQSRDRVYMIFWKKGQPEPDMNYYPKGFCNVCGKDVETYQKWKNGREKGKYRTQYTYNCRECHIELVPYYYAAFNAIDWTDLGTKIGDRTKPLSDATYRRIEYGLKKYKDGPFLSLGYKPGYNMDTSKPFGTITARDHHQLVTPFVINGQHSTGIGERIREISEQFFTFTTEPHQYLVSPFIIKEEHASQMNIRSVGQAFQTQTTRQSMALVIPSILGFNRTDMFRPATNPLTTIMTQPKHGLIIPEKWRSFLASYYKTPQAACVTEPMNTVTTRDRHQLITSFDQDVRIEDCYFRMLKPQEVKLGMAFDPEYIVLGDGKAQVRQLGNAVTPPVMEFLVDRVIGSLC